MVQKQNGLQSDIKQRVARNHALDQIKPKVRIHISILRDSIEYRPLLTFSDSMAAQRNFVGFGVGGILEDAQLHEYVAFGSDCHYQSSNVV